MCKGLKVFKKKKKKEKHYQSQTVSNPAADGEIIFFML